MAKNNNLVVLVIMDGWGMAGPNKGNAIHLAQPTNFIKYWNTYPHTVLQASGKSVGLPPKQVGNSEAGHMNIGAGRIAWQDAVVISRSITEGTFFKNPGFLQAVNHVKKNKSNFHLMGLLSSEQSAHADPDHILALITFLRLQKIDNVYLHLFTDGRDSPPFAAIKLLKKLKSTFLNGEVVASVIGRFYSMDRKKAWNRTEKAYNCMVLGSENTASHSDDAILHSYNKGVTDEYIEPTSMVYKNGKLKGLINDNDAVVFFNLRSDRARQLAKPFVQKEFEKMGGFRRKKVLKNLLFVAMTDFGPDLDSIVSAFPSIDYKDTLPMVLENYKQLYISETEKYAHVTYFFNGGYADPVANEDRIRIDSPKVDNYAKVPEMSGYKITEKIIKVMDKYNFICVNYPNPDMVGHTGDLVAGIKAVKYVDDFIGMLVPEVLKRNGTMFLTSDHGNADKMIDPDTDEIFTQHTYSPVPFIIIRKSHKKIKLKKNGGVLGDIAPTILDLQNIKKPSLMKGKSLIIR